VKRHVPSEQLGAVRDVQVRVGPLSGVVADSLEFCFSAIVSGGPLHRAHMEIETVPARVACAACGQESDLDGPALTCPGCGATDVELVSGSELEVVAVRLEDPAEESR